MILRDVSQGQELTDAGIREDHVNSPAAGLNRFVKTIEIRQVGDIALNTRYIVADGPHRLIKNGLASTGDEDVCAFLDEQMCRGQSDSRGAAGDDGHFAVQLTHT